MAMTRNKWGRETHLTRTKLRALPQMLSPLGPLACALRTLANHINARPQGFSLRRPPRSAVEVTTTYTAGAPGCCTRCIAARPFAPPAFKRPAPAPGRFLSADRVRRHRPGGAGSVCGRGCLPSPNITTSKTLGPLGGVLLEGSVSCCFALGCYGYRSTRGTCTTIKTMTTDNYSGQR